MEITAVDLLRLVTGGLYVAVAYILKLHWEEITKLRQKYGSLANDVAKHGADIANIKERLEE